VLDHVERRRFLEQPAREHAPPFLVSPAHVGLDKSAGQLLILPRRGRFACAQPDDHVADPHRLPRPHLEIAPQPVALVEQAQHCHPILHRRDRLAGGRRCGWFRLGGCLILGRSRIIAGRRRSGSGFGRSGGLVLESDRCPYPGQADQPHRKGNQAFHGAAVLFEAAP